MDNKWIQIIVGAVVTVVLVLLAFQVVDWMTGRAEASTKYWVCHVVPQKQDISLHLSWSGAYFGHIKKHDGDYWGKCIVEPTPEPTATPTRPPKPTATPTPTEAPEPTKRWRLACERELVRTDENGHEYCAEAIPQSSEPKEGFAWEEGMDKYCEVEEPEPTPVPEQPIYIPQNASTTDTPVCTDGSTTSLVANLHVIRNGTEATVNYFITQGDSSNIYYKLNGSDGWQHSIIGVKGNSENYVSYTIGGLDANAGYTFGVQQVQGCGSGDIATAVVVDPPAYGKIFKFSYWIW